MVIKVQIKCYGSEGLGRTRKRMKERESEGGKKNWKEEGLELKLTHIEMVEGNWGEKASHSYHIKTNHPPRC